MKGVLTHPHFFKNGILNQLLCIHLGMGLYLMGLCMIYATDLTAAFEHMLSQAGAPIIK